jgi:hypothetical protein
MQRKSQATQRKDIYYVLKPLVTKFLPSGVSSQSVNPLCRCSPQKLAKAFAFCLVAASQARTEQSAHASPLSTPGKILDSPQSLFALSSRTRSPAWELPANPGGFNMLDEYFPAGASLPPSRPDEASKPAAHFGEAGRLQPVLLLVDDNKINLRV